MGTSDITNIDMVVEVVSDRKLDPRTVRDHGRPICRAFNYIELILGPDST
jgi:hypothetical protein